MLAISVAVGWSGAPVCIWMVRCRFFEAELSILVTYLLDGGRGSVVEGGKKEEDYVIHISAGSVSDIVLYGVVLLTGRTRRVGSMNKHKR